VRFSGGLSHIQSSFPAWKLSRVQANFNAHFAYRKTGKFSEEESKKLTEMVRKANENQRRLRLWAAGNNKKIWTILLDHGVHIINVDKLAKFEKFHSRYVQDQL
jgi:glycerophosphoryl diester phosphodiesterase